MLKPILLTLSMLFLFGDHLHAQLNTGLIAHWRMNGNGDDATGNGHNGSISNVSAATGRSGAAGTAMEFAGNTSSYISVPYKSDLNLTSYSICAVVMPKGFYTSNCQVNQLFMRGDNNDPSHYSLFFTDNTYDSSCTVTGDTSRFTFYAGANTSDVNGGVSFDVYNKHWQYTPTIATNNWYCVVATFSRNTFKLYVDGVLKATSVANQNIPISSSTAGIAIGNNTWNPIHFPYSFKGLIDDMRLYNRALDPSEVAQYCTTPDTSLSVGTINPTTNDIIISPNPNAGNFTIRGIVNANAVTVSILNTLGQLVYKETIVTKGKLPDEYISLPAGIANGAYMIYIQAAGQSKALKFTLQR